MKLSNTTKEELLLYGVTDRAWLNGETLYSQVEKALKGGATFMQLREKKLDEESFLKEAIEIKELCRRYNVPFVINDNVDIALEMDADGVHVGQSDMEALDVRAKLGPDKIIGGHTHVGLKNLNRRLFLMYGENSSLHIESIPMEKTTISFMVPFNFEDTTL